MTEFIDAYAVLGVDPDAPQHALKAAHRRLVRRHHPDLAPEEERAEATTRVADVNVAYGLVRDAGSRRRYDALLAHRERAVAGSRAAGARSTTPWGGDSDAARAWDAAVTGAGRWAGRWWSRNAPRVAQARQTVGRAYARLLFAATVVAYVWVGTMTALGLGLLLRTDGRWALVAAAGGGAAVGVYQGRRGRRARRSLRSTAVLVLWVAAVATGLALDA